MLKKTIIMYKRIILYLILSIGLTFSCVSQKKNNSLSITVESSVFSDGDTIYLKQYQGKDMETLMYFIFHDKGTAVFTDKNLLLPGIYEIYQTPDTHFDFFISENQSQNFTISFNKNDLQGSLKFKKSPENETAYDFFKFIESKDKNIHQLQQDKTKNEDELKSEYQKTEDEISNKIQNIIKSHPDFCFTDYLLLKQKLNTPTPIIPMFVINRDSVMQAYYTHYVRNHFFDFVNFNSKALIGIPDYEIHLQTYFTQILSDDKDTTVKYLDIFLSRLYQNLPVYQFSIRYLATLYLQVPYDHLKSVYPYILEKYIIQKPQMWNNEVYIAETQEKLRLLKMNEVGTKAANLTLYSIDNTLYKISDFSKKYNILYFFDPDCHTCQETTPKLYQLYQQYQTRNDIEFYAIYVENDKNLWKTYIAEKNLNWINLWDAKKNQKIDSKYDISLLPSIYVIDQNQTVILRDIDINELTRFLKKLKP